MIWVFLISLFLLILLGAPIAFAMMISGVVMMLGMGIFDTVVIAENLVSGANDFALMAIPFFILTGEIMNAGGVSKRIVDFSISIVGHIRGGLGYVTIFAGVIFAGLSGSAVADVAALGAILIPMMVANGYDVKRSTGLLVSTGIIGTIIPPSIPLILFGVISGVSITKLFMGGIVPGLLIGIGLMVAWYFVSRKDDTVVFDKATWKERWLSAKRAFLALILPLFIIIGLRGGVFTPTEAGVFAAMYALVISFLYREISIKKLPAVFINTAKTTGVVLFLAAAAMLTAYVITIAQIPTQLASGFGGITDNPTVLLLLIMLFLLIVGMVMDMTPAILIFTPVLLPIVQGAGIDPIFFGVMMVINLSIGLITPPVGTALYVGAGIAKVSIIDVTKGIWPFLLVEIIVLFLLTLFPEIITVPLEWMVD
ncbi:MULTISPECIES: TRAP transporter large permease [Clostridia]|uniref:TRAP transporter large permease n=1 Tax=Clostridia TaxID=186801 RepID=UPI000EA136A0|nr:MULTISPECIES: TRAP transporter large permease [Clostridia]NBJ71613.1 TRAP transporter large permease [Roseburia sp. 1XD42-34]RKI76846.1 TRAP transporter large permease [Clostridium sp. 1xD42-85]